MAGVRVNDQAVHEVGEIYAWLDEELARVEAPGQQCNACGACCDFETFDHRLFVTSVEMMYFVAHVGRHGVRPMPSGRCPYQEDGKCTVYPHRFGGCRIFCCKQQQGAAGRELGETVLKKLKALCSRYGVAYRYMDLAKALNDSANRTCRSAGGSYPGDGAD